MNFHWPFSTDIKRFRVSHFHFSKPNCWASNNKTSDDHEWCKWTKDAQRWLCSSPGFLSWKLPPVVLVATWDTKGLGMHRFRSLLGGHFFMMHHHHCSDGKKRYVSQRLEPLKIRTELCKKFLLVLCSFMNLQSYSLTAKFFLLVGPGHTKFFFLERTVGNSVYGILTKTNAIEFQSFPLCKSLEENDWKYFSDR